MTPPPGMPAERWTRLIDVCRQMDDRANRGAGPPRPDHDGPCIPWAGFRLSFPVTDSVDGGVDREIHQEQRPANG